MQAHKQAVRLRSLPLNEVTINDPFWNRYIHLVRETIIPYQWAILNDQVEDAAASHCIMNFKIAAGEAEGEFQGAVFQDTDVYKWLEAVAFTLAVYPDEKLETLADETISLIGRAQQPDGYLNTYFTIKAPELRWTNLREGHELYSAGHMIEAAVAYYQATGKKNFLNIATNFADLICRYFGPSKEQCHGYPGHQEIELALVKLFQVTHKKEYLDTAKYFIDVRGVGENYFLKEEKTPTFKPIFPEFSGYDPKYSQSHLPVREQTTAEGHAVRAVYMYSAMADLAAHCQDESLLDACRVLWDDMVNRRMFITGSIGSSGVLERFTTDYDLPNDCNYSESCASIGLAMFGQRMAEVTKDAHYMDTVENALYNTILAGIALDGEHFFYVNPLEVWPDSCMPRTSKEHVKPVRQKWFGVACCPPNIARTLASLGQYMYFTDEEKLYVNLYLSNKVTTVIDGSKMTLTVDSDLLSSGEITCKVSSDEQTKEFTAAFRIPDYAKNFSIQKNGMPVNDYIIENNYAIVAGLTDGTELILNCPTPAVFVRANPQVRADVGKVAIKKGPLVYCLEETDNSNNLANLFINTRQQLETTYDPAILGGVMTVSFKGKRLDEQLWEQEELYAERQLPLQEVELKAVPYSSWNNRKAGEMIVWLKELL